MPFKLLSNLILFKKYIKSSLTLKKTRNGLKRNSNGQYDTFCRY